jgi:hypothetical protein
MFFDSFGLVGSRNLLTGYKKTLPDTSAVWGVLGLVK